MPANAILTLGGNAAALAVECGETRFAAADCRFVGASAFKCRR